MIQLAHPVIRLHISPVEIQFLQLPREEIMLFPHHRSYLRGNLVRVASKVVPVRQPSQSLLKRQGRVDVRINVAPGEPLVSQLGTAVQVDRGDDPHVPLPPFASAVGNLSLEELERVEAEIRLRHLQGLADDGRRFVLDEEEIPVRLILANFLHDAQVVDKGEEVATGKVRDGLFW